MDIYGILVGGAMEDPYYEDLELALDLYPSESHLTALMPVEVRETSSQIISYDTFRTTVPNIISRADPDDRLYFMQFGHGIGGPAMLLRDRHIGGRSLVSLFEHGIADGGNPGYTAIILGGCFSGGFARYFLSSEFFRPNLDFFYAVSPPHTVGQAGLRGFLSATLGNADFRPDGVLTDHERAIYSMNAGRYSEPLAVMFLLRGASDIDMLGRPAQLPYFPREVENISSHQELIRMMEGLRFGEQAVVYVGGSEENQELRRRFEEEAATGDGFYRFVSVPDNEESRMFFNTQGRPAVFVVGPNLRYHGVELRLEDDQHVGDQIPWALATENTLLVIASWKNKIERVVGRDGLQTYIEHLFSARNYYSNVERPFVLRSVELLASNSEGGLIQGLEMANIFTDMFDVNSLQSWDRDRLNQAARSLAQSVLNGSVTISTCQGLALLSRVLFYLGDILENGELLGGIVSLGLNRFGEDFVTEGGRQFLQWDSIPSQLSSALLEVLRNGSDEARIAVLQRSMGIQELETHTTINQIIIELLDENPSIELRRAISLYIRRLIIRGDFIEVLVAWLAEEEDQEVRENLILSLTESQLIETIREGNERDRIDALRLMASHEAELRWGIYEAVEEMLQGDLSVELRRALSLYLRGCRARGHLGDLILPWLAEEEDQEVRTNLILTLSESEWLQIMERGNDRDRADILRAMNDPLVPLNAESSAAIQEMLGDELSLEVRQALSLYLRRCSDSDNFDEYIAELFTDSDEMHHLSRFVLPWLEMEEDEGVRINLFWSLTNEDESREVCRMRPMLEGVIADEDASDEMHEAASALLDHVGELEEERREYIRGFFHLGFLARANFLGRLDYNSEITGTGGLGAGVTGMFTADLFQQERRAGAIFVQGGFDLDVHWSFGWFTTLLHATAGFMFRTESLDFAISGGWVGRYTPAVDYDSVQNGWTAEIAMFFTNIVDRRRFLFGVNGPGPGNGLFLNVQHFPENDSVSVTLGALFLLDRSNFSEHRVTDGRYY